MLSKTLVARMARSATRERHEVRQSRSGEEGGHEETCLRKASPQGHEAAGDMGYTRSSKIFLHIAMSFPSHNEP